MGLELEQERLSGRINGLFAEGSFPGLLKTSPTKLIHDLNTINFY